jgi:ABC-type dipeptide/oligopeptide/nickel transport system permease subunit
VALSPPSSVRTPEPAVLEGPVLADAQAVRSRSPVRRLVGDASARLGVVLGLLCLLLAVAGPWLAPHDPLEVTIDRLHGPSLRHPLGTDGLGRDLFSRLLHGARLSLGAAGMAAAAVTTVGLVVGLVAGYFGGFVDRLLMRVVDIVLAIPALVLALAVAGLFARPSLTAVLLALIAVWWAPYARIVRGLVLTVRERGFVESARSLGAADGRIMGRHIVPNVVSPVLVLATLEVGQLLLAISGLTFLGVGAPPPTPEWGGMLNEGRVYFLSNPHVVLVPGLAISLSVLGFNLLGDAVRDALDPRLALAPGRGWGRGARLLSGG